jgi:hypothetical protein
MAYKMITLEATDEPYPPEFLNCLRSHQEEGWSLVFISWSGCNPIVLFQKP